MKSLSPDLLQNLPPFISIAFIAITVATLVWLCYLMMRAELNVFKIAIGLVAWLGVQAGLSATHFYTSDLMAMPPLILLTGILPALLFVAMLFATANGRVAIDKLSLKHLTLLHTIRIPVELVLWQLSLQGAVPVLMTFEGRNFDILVGLTAPWVSILAFSGSQTKRRLLLVWNIISLGLLINIVVNAFLSAPFPAQMWAFDTPNVAILFFPFVWLPVFIVPAVLFAHLVALRRLLK